MYHTPPTAKIFRILVLGFALVTAAVGVLAGPVWAFQMAIAFPAVLWIARLLRAAGSGKITRRLEWWANSGYRFRMTRPRVVRRADRPLVFWAYVLREAMFCAALSAFLLVPLVRSLLEQV
jgi:hypothetical protein